MCARLQHYKWTCGGEKVSQEEKKDKTNAESYHDRNFGKLPLLIVITARLATLTQASTLITQALT